jgi:hydroxyacylglutathione hydrolase
MIVWEKNGITIVKSALFETLSAVIQTEELMLVVDPCWLPNEVRWIRSYVDRHLGGRPLYLLFTHSDYDHIIGYLAFPEAKVIASQAFRDRTAAEKDAVIEQIHAFDDDYYVTRDYPIAYPVVDLAIGTEGERWSLGSTVLTFYQAAGHNADGMMTVVEPGGLLIAGDYLSDVEFPYIYHSSAEYEHTLGKLDRILTTHDIKLLMTGHGNVTDDRSEMKRRQQASLAYIHELRSAVESDDRARLDAMIDGHAHPRAKRKFHLANQRLIAQEMRARNKE